MAKAPKRPDPRQMAAEAVQKWHSAIMEGPEAHYAGSIYQVTLDQALDDVTAALIAEHIAEYGVTDAEGREICERACERAAGYLVGVQVGMRLRGH